MNYRPTCVNLVVDDPVFEAFSYSSWLRKVRTRKKARLFVLGGTKVIRECVMGYNKL